MSRTVVVVPCYNEAERLDAGRFRRFAAGRDDVRFILVNDGSTDRTLSLLERLHDDNPEQFHICDLPENRGKAEAVRRGILAAFRLKPDCVGFWDADLATPLEAIAPFTRLLDRRAEIEMVIGTRIPLLGRAIRRAPRRRWLGCVFSAVASRVLGIGIYDTQCGAKMFRASAEMQALFETPFSTRWIFDVEVLARLIRNRRLAGEGPASDVIYEMPLEAWQEKAGSKLRGRDFAKAAIELAVIWRKNLLGLGRLPIRPTEEEPGQADVLPFPSEQSEGERFRDAA